MGLPQTNIVDLRLPDAVVSLDLATDNVTAYTFLQTCRRLHVIGPDTSSGAHATITMPPPSDMPGVICSIHVVTKAGSDDVIVAFPGSLPADKTITVDEGHVLLYSDGHQWYVISEKLS